MLSAPAADDRIIIEARMDNVLEYADDLIKNFDKSMNILNQSNNLENS